MPEGHCRHLLFCRLQRESQLFEIKNIKKKIDKPESILGKVKWTKNHNI